MDSLPNRRSFFLVRYISYRDDHHALYLPNEGDRGPGRLYHVTGSLYNGMVFEARDTGYPPESPAFNSMSQLGWVTGGDESIRPIFEQIPPPAKQYDGGRRLVPLDKIRHCQHWAKEAYEELIRQGVLQPLQPSEEAVEVRRSQDES